MTTTSRKSAKWDDPYAGAESVLCEVIDRVALVTWNRPDRLNAWTDTLEDRYFELLEELADTPEVRVIVLTGAGRGFCAGADLDLLLATSQQGQGPLTDPDRFNLPLRIPKPIIAAVNGPCAGIGFIHALMCDLRFAATGAKFTTAFARRGLVGEYNAPWLLTRMVGHARALDLLYSARIFLAEEAAELGVVNQVFEADDLLPTTLAYARDLAEKCSPAALAMIKKQAYRQMEIGLAEATRETLGWMEAGTRTADQLEGVESFLAKRAPRFDGLPPGVRLDTSSVPGFEV